METVNNQSDQTEVSLRTLSSDITSAQHGATTPVSESFKVTVQPPSDEDEAEQTAPATSKTGHTIVLIIVLAAIAAAAYFYVYPLLVAALSTPAAVH